LERAKIGLLAVIALALCARLGMDLVPEARADPGRIECNAFYVEDISAQRNVRNATAWALAHASQVRDWLLQHPGDPVYRATMRHGDSLVGWIEVICVR
jgi:hypothetical protein